MRIAFRMRVNPGCQVEYEKRHNPIWQELETALYEHGVRSYSIFLDPDTDDLFAYAEIEDLEQWRQIADTEICRRWWDHMAPLMPVNQDNSPQTRELKEVFHIPQ
jgi:L-rhamnose mutarotase